MSHNLQKVGAYPVYQGERTFFHGGEYSLRAIDPGRHGADGELLCASASPNVALRYGAAITCLTLTRWATMTLAEFFECEPSFEDMRAAGVGAVIVEGSPDSFDFPVESVFILDPMVARIGMSGTVEALGLQLDALPQREPAGPSEAGWDLYVSCVFGGLTDALEALDWEVGTHHWKVRVPADSVMREFIGLVTEDGNGGYLAEHNFGTAITPHATLGEALVAIDIARRNNLTARRLITERLRRKAGLVDEVYEDEDADVPL